MKKRKNLNTKLDALNKAIPYQRLVEIKPKNTLHNLYLMDWFIDGGELCVEMNGSPYSFEFSLRKENILLKRILNCQNNYNYNLELPLNDYFERDYIKPSFTALGYFLKHNSKIQLVDAIYNHNGVGVDWSEDAQLGWENVTSKEYRIKKLHHILKYIKAKAPDMSDIGVRTVKQNTVKEFFEF